MLALNKLFHFWHVGKRTIKDSLFELITIWQIKLYTAITLILNILIWLLARYIYVGVEQDQIALHYSVDFGIDLYGNTGKVFIIPVLGLVFVLINTMILSVVNRYNKKDIVFLIHILLVTAMIANIMLLMAMVSIYLINFR